ncbi:RAP domain-containing protein [Wolffia australiana]
MEGPLNAVLRSGYSPWLLSPANPSRDFQATSTRTSQPAHRKLRLSVAAKDPGASQEIDRDWKEEFMGEASPQKTNSPTKKKPREKSRLLADTESLDWCNNARRVAVKSIESRGLAKSMESIVLGKKKKKKDKKPNTRKKTQMKIDLEDEDEDEDLVSGRVPIDLQQRVSFIADGMFEEMKEKAKEAFIEKLSQFSGPSNRRREISLNRDIVEAQTAEEVLEVASEAISAVAKGLSPSPLTPINISTALHRIAKNMEKVSMPRTRRLSFARQREMCMLVGISMVNLPDCSAQGISNISWALAKIGGELLYHSEMDRVAEVAFTRVEEFNSQNVANVAAAFATMQHSALELFALLSSRAAEIISLFQEKELAQVLWAFASLNEPADALLNAMDRALDDGIDLSYSEEEMGERIEDQESTVKLNFSRTQLGNLVWAYAVLGEMERPFFSRLWGVLSSISERKVSEQLREDVLFASQVLIASQCLKTVYPHLDLSLPEVLEEKIGRLGKTKRFNQKVTSSFQKEVGRLLVGTGLDWVREYVVDGYTLDAALVDRKLAFEIDGPTHFSRNTGAPLGHTVLKRRYIAAAGWRVVSLSHMEWEGLQGASEQSEYLRKILGINPGNDDGENVAEMEGSHHFDDTVDLLS